MALKSDVAIPCSLDEICSQVVCGPECIGKECEECGPHLFKEKMSPLCGSEDVFKYKKWVSKTFNPGDPKIERQVEDQFDEEGEMVETPVIDKTVKGKKLKVALKKKVLVVKAETVSSIIEDTVK